MKDWVELDQAGITGKDRGLGLMGLVYFQIGGGEEEGDEDEAAQGAEKQSHQILNIRIEYDYYILYCIINYLALKLN